MTRGSHLIDFRWAPEEGMYVTWRIYQGFIVALWMLQVRQLVQAVFLAVLIFC